ncbi:hypothetical protein K2X89_17610, partial [Myxococcota bacterium]|nr:hypothetical protein [Myxococcota bacterium]
PFCYAGKAHPELAPEGRLAVSYVCNLFVDGDDAVGAVLERLRTTHGTYRPRIMDVAVPPE